MIKQILYKPHREICIGGPRGHGLHWKKIVDTYGGVCSPRRRRVLGKDRQKSTEAHAMRPVIAKNVVAAGFAKRCEIQLAYAIGVARPVSVFVKLERKQYRYRKFKTEF